MRLDLYLVAQALVPSRVRAKTLIEEGCVILDGKMILKPSYEVDATEHTVNVQNDLRYVSRGGLKLEAALQTFKIDPSGLEALDIGASTGGFTDCLLQAGALTVTAVDAGEGQLAAKLCNDKRVYSYEHLNARDLTSEQLEGHLFDLIVMDVSFISATYILPRFPSLLRDGGRAVILVKPQFEVGRQGLGKRGIVKDDKWLDYAVNRVRDAASAVGLRPCGVIPSPICGGDGNREFLLYLRK